MRNKYEIRGVTVAIFFKSKKFGIVETIIETEDLARMEGVLLSASWDKTTNSFYVICKIQKTGKFIGLHRYLMNAPDHLLIDHINRITMDNRKINLRTVTPSESLQNTGPRSNNTSGERGVVFSKRHNKWIVKIQVQKVRHSLGYYDDYDQAVKVAKEARARLMPLSPDANVTPITDRNLFEHRINARADNKTSGIRNISWHKKLKKWYVSIYVDKKTKYIGTYEDINSAKEALEKAKENILKIS